jgi:hypothetical protein
MIHSFNTTLAERYGIEEAILIEHLYWWIHKNDCEDVEEMIKNNRVWCRTTAKGIAKYIPYMSPQKIRRVILGLEGKIVIGNFNKQATNHTLWYAFSNEFIEELEQLGYDFSKMKIRNFKNEKSNNIIIDNNLIENNIIENNKKELSCDNSKKTKEGSLFSNVTDEKEKNYLEHMYEHYPLIMKMDKPLTYAEFKTLRENFDVDLVWDKMDNLENTKNMRKKYVSAYLTLNNWCKMSFNRESKKKEDEQ